MEVLRVAGPSVLGYGVFAREGYAEGFPLGRWCPDAKLRKVPRGASFFYGPTLSNGHIIDAITKEGRLLEHPTVFINHDFDANVAVESDGVIVALRAIDAGEELRMDYGLSFLHRVLPLHSDATIYHGFYASKGMTPCAHSNDEVWVEVVHSVRLRVVQEQCRRGHKMAHLPLHIPDAADAPRATLSFLRDRCDSEREYKTPHEVAFARSLCCTDAEVRAFDKRQRKKRQP